MRPSKERVSERNDDDLKSGGFDAGGSPSNDVKRLMARKTSLPDGMDQLYNTMDSDDSRTVGSFFRMVFWRCFRTIVCRRRWGRPRK